MGKVSSCFVVLLLLAFSLKPLPAFAGEVDVLIDKLVEKGILTPSEAQIIVDETKAQVAKEMSQAKADTAPTWTQKIKMKGDLRARYQWEERETSDTDRERARVRFRLGMEADVVDKVKVGAGLATGGTDLRSTNQTLQNVFDTPDIRLDYAFAEYKPFDWMSLIGGKYKNKEYLYRPSDLLWDSDINPEGVGINLAHSPFDNLDLFLNGGFWILDENSTNTDPVMWVAQPGFKIDIIDNIYLKGAYTYYDFNNVKSSVLDNSNGTNTLNPAPGSGLMFDYDSHAIGAELGIKEPFGEDVAKLIPFVALFGEYINNPDPDDDNEGWLVGAKIGHKKVKKAKNWQAKYMYRRLERDAWLDTFPDSDSYGGDTHIKGHEAILNYAIFDNVILGLDYYHTENLSGTIDKEDIFQTDLLFKF